MSDQKKWISVKLCKMFHIPLWRYFKTRFQNSSSYFYFYGTGWMFPRQGKLTPALELLNLAYLGSTWVSLLRAEILVWAYVHSVDLVYCQNLKIRKMQREREIELESGIYANQHLQPHNHGQSRICQSCWCQSVFDSGDPPPPTTTTTATPHAPLGLSIINQ